MIAHVRKICARLKRTDVTLMGGRLDERVRREEGEKNAKEAHCKLWRGRGEAGGVREGRRRKY